MYFTSFHHLQEYLVTHTYVVSDNVFDAFPPKKRSSADRWLAQKMGASRLVHSNALENLKNKFAKKENHKPQY